MITLKQNIAVLYNTHQWLIVGVRKIGRKVWSEHRCTNKDGRVFDFTVLECPKNRVNDVIDLYQKYYMKDEAAKKLSGISKSKEAIEEYTKILTKQLKAEGANIAVCIENSTDTMVGVSSMILLESHSQYSLKIPDIKTKGVAKQLEILEGLKNLYDFPKSFSVRKYYDDLNLIVHPDYRALGIGKFLVESRTKICKAHGVPITCAWLTSIASQKLLERDGWETVLEIDSHEFALKLDMTPYDGMPPTFRFVVKGIL